MEFDESAHERKRVLECLERALANKNMELEAIIGNSSHNTRNTRIDFVNVIKRIKGKAPFLRETQTDSLIIGIQGGEYSKDISRVILTGGLIGQYCANESLMPITNRVIFEKKGTGTTSSNPRIWSAL